MVVSTRLTTLLFFAMAYLCCGPCSGQSTSWTIDPAHSTVEFKVRHLGVSNVHGTFAKLMGTVKWNEKELLKSSVEATVDCATVNTNESGRDTHLKGPDFFNVEKYPSMVFRSTSLTRADNKLFLNGDLTLAGVTKQVSLTLDGPAPPQTDAKGVTRSGFSASGIIHRADFNFGSKYPAVVIGDEISISIDIEIDKQG